MQIESKNRLLSRSFTIPLPAGKSVRVINGNFSCANPFDTVHSLKITGYHTVELEYR